MKSLKALIVLTTVFVFLLCNLSYANTSSRNDSSYTVYYFHMTKRCFTCNKIEKDTRAIINEAYANRLPVKNVNVQDKENAHFVKDFSLVSSSVVLVENNADKSVKRFKVLSETWSLVKNEAKFKEYILNETKTFIGE